MTPVQEVEQQLTDFRLRLSSLEHAVKQALDTKLSYRPETTLSLRNIQRASMWLGKCKGALGIRSPYPQSFNPESKDIEPRSDQAKAFALPKDADEITAVKAIRNELNKLEDFIWSTVNAQTDKPKFQVAITEAYISVCDATMCLGMTLNSIYNETAKSLPADALPAGDTPVVPPLADMKPSKGSSEQSPAMTVESKPTEGQNEVGEKKPDSSLPPEGPTETPIKSEPVKEPETPKAKASEKASADKTSPKKDGKSEGN